MEYAATAQEKLRFLLEAEADWRRPRMLSAVGADETPGTGARPKYVTNYIGSKQKLIDWIWEETPEGVTSVLDGFSGSAVVSYMYKGKGLQVIANDRLRYCYHAARAIIENDEETIVPDDARGLIGSNAKAGTFVRDNFEGVFFANGVHELIDTVRANIDGLDGYQQDIALFALGKTCLGAKGGFGHFTSTQDYGNQDSPEEFKQRFVRTIARINALAFSNGKACSAHCGDIVELLPDVKADLAYFDPPYATEYSTTNYEKAYHFIEGLMTYWEGLEIKAGSKTRQYSTDHQTVTKGNANGFFTGFLGAAKHIPRWMISYRDHAYPNEDAMRGIIRNAGKDVELLTHDHRYSISARQGEASQAKELLFVCTPGKANASKASLQARAITHSETSDPGVITVSLPRDLAPAGDGSVEISISIRRTTSA